MRMASRCVRAFLALALLLGAAVPPPAFAQNETGKITVTVEDALTQAPISMARVLLNGPVLTTEFSAQNGRVTFSDVPGGVYTARVTKKGFNTVTSAQFEVLDGKAVAIAVSLAKSQELKTIGEVTVKSSADISTSSISETSTVRRLSDTLSDALGKLSGVAINTDATGDSDASETVSLEGQDPSQTALSLDGIPLNAPGVAGDLRSINTDLFSGASLSFGPRAGSLAGGVNFRSLEPTLSWQSKLSASAGTYAKGTFIVSEQGTSHHLGIAFTHSLRNSPNPIDGAYYLDASGLAYSHDGAAQNDGDLLKLRYYMGTNHTLTAFFMSSYRFQDVNCFQFTGPLPCGYGPDNSSFGRFSLLSVGDTALIGATALQFSAYGTNSRNDRDLLDRLVQGVAAPTGTEFIGRTRGASINAQLASGERHTITLQATTNASTSATNPLVAQAAPYATFTTTSSFSTLSISDRIRSSPKLAIGTSFGLSNSTSGGSSILGGVNAAWSPTARDAFNASFNAGGSGPNNGRYGFLTDPQALRFNCNGSIAFGNGPGDQPGATSSTSERAGWQHRFSGGQLGATLYRQVQNDTILPTTVNAAALPTNYFPPGYFAFANHVYQSNAGCGTTLSTFGPQNLYLTIPIGGVRRVYEGAQLSAGLQVGGSLVIAPYYNIQVAKALSGDTRITNPLSVVIPGQQLPNTPLHAGGVTLDYKAPRSAIEGLFNARYTAANNRQNLPANVVVDAGLNVNFDRGSLTLAGTNVFNTLAGIFSTPAGAVPLQTANGTLVPTIARPNAPRQFSVTYILGMGPGADVRNNGLSLAKAASERRGPGGPMRRFGITPIPDSPPANPLAIDTSRPSCTAGYQKMVGPKLDQVRAYVAQIEAAKSASGYPESAPPPPDIAGVALTYHKTASSYALSMTLSQNELFRPFIGCAALHVANLEQVASKNLYNTPNAPFFRRPLIFMPATGFYIVLGPPPPGRALFRLYKLPASAPAKPFAVRAGDSCSAELEPAATRLLGALQQYFANTPDAATRSAAIDGWKVYAHATSGGPWYELQPNEPTALPALLNCGRVAVATPDEVKAAGLGGVTPPALNYAEKLGLYFVRRTRPPPQGESAPGAKRN